MISSMECPGGGGLVAVGGGVDCFKPSEQEHLQLRSMLYPEDDQVVQTSPAESLVIDVTERVRHVPLRLQLNLSSEVVEVILCGLRAS